MTLEFKQENGVIGVGQTLTDLERNNRELKSMRKVLWYFAGLGTAFLLLILWGIYYLISHEVINHIVERCIC